MARSKNVPQRQLSQRGMTQSVQQTFTVSMHSPLPPPELLAQYEQDHPGTTDIFIQWINDETEYRRSTEERDQAHLHKMEVRQGQRSTLGLAFGFIVALSGMGTATWLGLQGHDAVAGVIGALDLVGLAGLFVYGSTQRAKQDDPQKG